MSSLLTHCSHPNHRLFRKESPSGGFTCNICCAAGSGLHYRCDACDFDLHEHCSRLYETISFFAHPWHPLHLMPGQTRDPRVCDLCSGPVRGFFYRCVSCNFDVHPHCTMTTQTLRTALHPEHSLCLVPGLSVCGACHEFNGVWLYRCGLCNVNLHIKCVYGPINPTAITSYGSGSWSSYGQSNSHQINDLRNKLNHLLRFGSEVALGNTIPILVSILNNLVTSFLQG